MKQKLIITLGLPASGKTTWSKLEVSKSPTTTFRVCRDDIRNMLGPYWIPSRENEVTMIENSCVDIGLHKGYSVIVDATNFSSVNKWKQLAADIKIPFEIMDFCDISPSICIQRDQQRENPVGKEVIERMYNKYILKK